jgi:nucleoside 2-deoxyribosyltransferase
MSEGNKKKCYVASPCGFADSTGFWYKQELLPALEPLVEVVDPWTSDVSHILRLPVAERRPGWTALGLDHYHQVETSDMVVAILDQEPPDNGTVCEVAYAAARRIPVIGYRNDTRMSGEEGCQVNLMILAAIERSDGSYTTSLPDLIAEVTRRS